MIFCQTGKKVLWDANKNRLLCKFENGEFETEDPYTINRLMEMGTAYIKEEIDVGVEKEIGVDFEDMNIKELRKYAKEKEYKGWSNYDKATLLKFLKEKEV